ncbi:hypothetical protein [Novosphingobium guangzhouense]|uniref:DUF3108 domain-containing protein n=1 Tax=Novosphingobium guangzhouense TaxID=1850347 RepID=A0A2K2FX57_9SPHN|nr:hypothetical protein [Novosphingobium guangzhouense]PNU03352.1 hypothetical protein A8V01_06390 [Novosphingobium guangzhouense]
MTYQIPKHLSGRVVHLKEGDEEWGREAFTMSVWDKGRLMNATIEFDDRKVLRNATWSVDGAWNPIEAQTREFVDGDLKAHCWFRIDGTAVEAEIFSQEAGRFSQRLEAGKRIDYLGMHTILADVLVAAACGTADPGVEKPVTCVTNSTSEWGMGHYRAHCVTPLVTYIAREEITVRAGAFEAEHFKVRWSEFVPEYADFWVTPGDYLPLRLQGSFGPVRYELAQIDLGLD